MGWLTGFANRIEMSIDHSKIDSDLTDFPVMIHLSASCGTGDADETVIFDELGSNKLKLAVTISDGETQCYVEVSYWDPTGETALLFVRVPNVSSSTDTPLYLYYDSAASDNAAYVGNTGDAAAENVWDSDFLAVFHLESATNITDSTSNGSDGTTGGTVSQIAGTVGGYGLFLNVGYFTLTSPGFIAAAGTIEMMVQIATAKSYNFLFCEQGTDNNNNEIEVYVNSSNALASVVWSGTSAQQASSNPTLSADSSWHGISFGWDSTKLSTFKDGAEATYKNTPGLPSAVSSSLYVGSRPGLDYKASVYLQEYRVSKVRRSDAWRESTYYSNTDALILFAGEEMQDASLSLSACRVNTEDMAAYLRAHDGLETRDMQVLLAVIEVWKKIDLSIYLTAVSVKLDDLSTWLSAGGTSLRDLAMLLAVTDGETLGDLIMCLAVTDGETFKDARLALQALSAAPAFRAVTAQRASSVISEAE